MSKIYLGSGVAEWRDSEGFHYRVESVIFLASSRQEAVGRMLLRIQEKYPLADTYNAKAEENTDIVLNMVSKLE